MKEQLEKLNKRHERLQLLYQVSNVIHSTLEAQEALQLIVSEAVRLMSASSGSVVLINPTTGLSGNFRVTKPAQRSHEIETARGRRRHRLGRASWQAGRAWVM